MLLLLLSWSSVNVIFVVDLVVVVDCWCCCCWCCCRGRLLLSSSSFMSSSATALTVVVGIVVLLVCCIIVVVIVVVVYWCYCCCDRLGRFLLGLSLWSSWSSVVIFVVIVVVCCCFYQRCQDFFKQTVFSVLKDGQTTKTNRRTEPLIVLLILVFVWLWVLVARSFFLDGFSLHSLLNAFLITTVLTPIPLTLVHRAVFVLPENAIVKQMSLQAVIKPQLPKKLSVAFESPPRMPPHRPKSRQTCQMSAKFALNMIKIQKTLTCSDRTGFS